MPDARVTKVTRGLSVAASSSLLLLSLAGSTSAHVAANGRVVDATNDDLRSRIMSMEPDLDENEVEDLVDEVENAQDEADAEDAASGTTDPGQSIEPRRHAHDAAQAEAEPEKHVDKPEATDSHHDSADDENDDQNDENEADDGEHGSGDHQDGHDGGSDGDSGDGSGGGSGG